jgi:hypothetical protein
MAQLVATAIFGIQRHKVIKGERLGNSLNHHGLSKTYFSSPYLSSYIVTA